MTGGAERVETFGAVNAFASVASAHRAHVVRQAERRGPDALIFSHQNEPQQ
jgi:hypothetical protein